MKNPVVGVYYFCSSDQQKIEDAIEALQSGKDMESPAPPLQVKAAAGPLESKNAPLGSEQEKEIAEGPGSVLPEGYIVKQFLQN